MTKFIEVTPRDNYILHVVTNDGGTFDFDVLNELKRIPSYKRLYYVDFF